MGFEPLRAEPSGFLVHHLSHSVTLSLESLRHASWTRWIRPGRITTFAYPSSSEEAQQDGQLAVQVAQPKASDVGPEPVRSGPADRS